jgi:hypothetical protein|nr:MAG TPA: hypothetical protein [Caudoviricetes sp.]
MTDYLPWMSYFDTLIHNINAYNRCFYDLAKRGEIVAAYPLVRLVADNLKIMVAEYLYPEQILPNIFEKGRELNQIRINGEKLKPSEINDKIKELYPEYSEIYTTYSSYVHPSKEGNILAKVYGDDIEAQKEVKHSLRTIKRTKAEWDLVKLNRFITDIIWRIIERNKAIIKENPELKARYWERLQELIESYPPINENSQSN